MRILFFDCFSGIAGDMVVGALRDLGVPERIFFDALESLGMPEGIHAHFSRGIRQGVSGWKFDVHTHSHAAEHDHAHAHPHDHSSAHSHGHAHDHHSTVDHVHGRTYAQIRDLIEASSLSSKVKSRAQAVFLRIAEAEGRIHGVPPLEVGFHEVGAEDSIADIVCACAGLESLEVDRVRASHLVEGSGWIRCAHGKFPLPAPATLAILQGISLRQVEEEVEFITPTGAAILAEYSSGFGPMPPLRISSIGYGLGSRDTPPRPNVLRAVVGEGANPAETDEVVVLETNLDDLTPELVAAASLRLFANGALDVYSTPVMMKKGRPGFVLSVIAQTGDADRIAQLMLEETSAFGVRKTLASRLKLHRKTVMASTAFGEIEIKLGLLGERVLHATPEFESCWQAAERAGISARAVYLAAAAAAEELKTSARGSR